MLKFKIQDIFVHEIDNLDPGESQAIRLAKELGLGLLIEEDDGRTVASKAGIEISGIGGQILKSFKKGLIEKNDALHRLQELFQNLRLDKTTFEDLQEQIVNFS